MAEEDPSDFTGLYNTPLPLDRLFDYTSKYSPNDNYDYDMQGFHYNNPDASMTPGQHFPDTYKKPNHPTFSNQSMYHNIPEDTDVNYKGATPGKDFEGGSWDLLDDGSFAFTPGRTNLQHHSPQDLIDYFKKNEPGNHLVLPGY